MKGGSGEEELGWFHQKTSIMLCVWRIGRSKTIQSLINYSKDFDIYPKDTGNPMRGLHGGLILLLFGKAALISR